MIQLRATASDSILAWRAKRNLLPAPLAATCDIVCAIYFPCLQRLSLCLSVLYLVYHGAGRLLILRFPTMLRSSLHRSGSCLSRGIYPLKRSTCSATTPKASSVPLTRSLRLPILSQRSQSRHYAVAAEETNKGVVSSLAGGTNRGKMKLRNECSGSQ